DRLVRLRQRHQSHGCFAPRARGLCGHAALPVAHAGMVYRGSVCAAIGRAIKATVLLRTVAWEWSAGLLGLPTSCKELRSRNTRRNSAARARRENADSMPGSVTGRPRVGLFVTCLVDLFRPSVGFAAAKLLSDAGCDVDVPASQTCCGQPAYNSGDKTTAEEIARLTIAAFEAHDYVVAPSGSCAGMLKLHYPALLARDPAWKARAAAFAAKVHA